MKSKFVILISLLAAAAMTLSACSTGENNQLSASGTFSALETNISSEISGKVTEINVREGDEVEVGQALFKIDDEVIQAQYDQASAAVNAAEAAVETAVNQAASADAQYQLALQAALMQELPNREALWATETPENYQPAWYFYKTELVAAAQTGVENAEDALATALADLAKEQSNASSKDFTAAENRLAVAQSELTVAINTLNKVNTGDDDELKATAEKNKTAAQAEFDSALAEYQRFLTTSAADAIIQARSRVAVAQANLDNARSSLLSLQTGDQSLQVIAAKAAAEAAASGVKQAEAAVEQAKQGLALAQLQLDRATVKAPISGVVVTRNLEIGDLVVAGGTVIRIAQLDTLNLVVYLPEDQYGQVSLGDSVNITVDSFSNRAFSGEVIHIADEAEYTPKNVQTESGRKATVYAVKIEVANADHKLKSGMPADAEFSVH